MTRGTNKQQRINSNWKSGAVKAERSRLRKRINSLEKHSATFDRAICNFSGTLDSKEWRQAFDSDDPDDIDKVMLVTGNFSTLINNYVEALKAGARLMGLYDNKRRAKDALKSIVTDGGLNQHESDTIQQLYKMEGRIQHVSPDVNADEVRDAVLTLQKELPGLQLRLRKWLEIDV